MFNLHKVSGVNLETNELEEFLVKTTKMENGWVAWRNAIIDSDMTSPYFDEYLAIRVLMGYTHYNVVIESISLEVE